MDRITQEIIGRVLYEATVDKTNSRIPEWDAVLNKDMWILKAEKVVEAFLLHVREEQGKGRMRK